MDTVGAMKYAIRADTIEYNGPSRGMTFVLLAVFVPVSVLSLVLLGWALFSGSPVWVEILLGALLLCSGLLAALAVVSYRASRSFRLKIDRKLRLVTTGRGKQEKTELVGEFQSLLIQKVGEAKGRPTEDAQYHVYLAGSLRRTPLGIVSLSENGARQKITPIALFLELPVIVIPENAEAAAAIGEKQECVNA